MKKKPVRNTIQIKLELLRGSEDWIRASVLQRKVCLVWSNLIKYIDDLECRGLIEKKETVKRTRVSRNYNTIVEYRRTDKGYRWLVEIEDILNNLGEET